MFILWINNQEWGLGSFKWSLGTIWMYVGKEDLSETSWLSVRSLDSLRVRSILYWIKSGFLMFFLFILGVFHFLTRNVVHYRYFILL